MRVAIVAESFLPNVNGVVNSVLRVLEHLRDNGHEALVIAPGARDWQEEIAEYAGFRIARVPTVEMPGINSLPIGVPMPAVHTELKRFRPDVVHLASPFVLGGAGALAAKSLGLPCVAVYQTDVAGFAQNYKMKALSAAAWSWTRALHNNCTLTLAPSSVAIAELEQHGIRGVNHWGRGVDTTRFHPSKRSSALRGEWLAGGRLDRTIVGFVGRLAAEKSVHRLRSLNDREDIQLVVIGDGPERTELERELPGAVFTGGMYGEDLPRAYASLDILVHTGEFETFCQVIQEAHASGVPTIAPAEGGPIDLVTDGVTGWLLNVATFEEELPGAVDRIIGGGLERYGAAAFEGVQGKTWGGLCDQLLGYYRAAIAYRTPAAGVRRFGLSQPRQTA